MSSSPEAGSAKADLDFSQLILGFSSAALYYLGQVPLEGSKPPQTNLPLASQNINIIALLRDKTKGNLDADELKLIEQLLADLQLKYVEATKSST